MIDICFAALGIISHIITRIIVVKDFGKGLSFSLMSCFGLLMFIGVIVISLMTYNEPTIPDPAHKNNQGNKGVDFIGNNNAANVQPQMNNSFQITPDKPTAKINNDIAGKHYERNSAEIRCIKGMYSGGVFPIKDAETIVIGRDPKEANIVINNGSSFVSRRHCEISFYAFSNRYKVYCCSKNGIRLGDGRKIKQDSYEILNIGDTISIGNNENVFELK